MLLLAATAPFSSGYFRDCYRHPDDPARCVKIVRPARAEMRPRRIDRLLGRRPADPNLRELHEYRRHKDAGVPLERYFPHVHGFVETDLGRGLLVDFLTGTDGKPPVSVLNYFRGERVPGLDPADVLEQVAEFAGFCERHGILASCDEPRNMGLLRNGDVYRLAAYDLKVRENKQLIPLASYVPFLLRRKIARRFDRRIEQLRGYMAGG